MEILLFPVLFAVPFGLNSAIVAPSKGRDLLPWWAGKGRR
jgi:hypothetical protein